MNLKKELLFKLIHENFFTVVGWINENYLFDFLSYQITKPKGNPKWFLGVELQRASGLKR